MQENFITTIQYNFPFKQPEIIKHQNRKKHNQYFTPEFAVEKALSLISETNIKNIIDPAVGNGIFLKISSEKWQSAKLFGIDIDDKMIVNLQKELHSNNTFFMNADGLKIEAYQKNPEMEKILSNSRFDLVVGNPPFSSWFSRINDITILSQYELAGKNGSIQRSQAIEVLFLEKFIQLAKKDGYVVIVLPDGILSNPKDQHIREFILRETVVKNIISLPRNVFEDTSAKTSILILQKKWQDNLNYITKISDLGKTGIVNNTVKVSGKDLLKRMDYWYYYNLRKSSMNSLKNNGIQFRPLKDFVIYCKTGKTLYGKERKFSKKGLRFLHATNITDIGIDYEKNEKFIDPLSKMNFPDAYTKVSDIIFVRVGVGCAGRVAIVDSKNDEGVASDYLHILRVKKINPYYLVVYLKTKYGRDAIQLLKHGVGTVSINKTDVLSIPIPFMPDEFQEKVEKCYKKVISQFQKGNIDETTKKLNALIQDVESELQNGESYGTEKKKIDSPCAFVSA
ncbi:MAG: hypothetical protein COS68_02760 [Elusimicrobia bacterium CG06_land_8_20_14_3_00_38_11]|nr:MAG: hypothetical protein COS68_02760 [Elusimicrobia bacterium CG06_land_8_20_14_3_00_38_11]